MAVRIILQNLQHANANLTFANFLPISLIYFALFQSCEVPARPCQGKVEFQAELATNPLIQTWRIVLDPTPDRDVVYTELALRHDVLQIPQIPPEAQNDDHVLEVPPTEERRPLLAHRFTLPDRPRARLQHIRHTCTLTNDARAANSKAISDRNKEVR